MAPFLEEEIKNVVGDYGSDKSLVLDGYNFNFIKNFWDMLKGDICKMFNDFHVFGVIPMGGYASFTTLISKMENPQGLNHLI